MNQNIPEDKLYDLLVTLGIEVSSQTARHYLCLCPFHENNDSPAFEIDKVSGLWLCFSSACGAKGNLTQLVERIQGGRVPELNRVLKKMNQDKSLRSDVEQELANLLGGDEPTEDWEKILENVDVDYNSPNWETRLQYLVERGFLKSTLQSFEVGYSNSKQRIVIPVRDEAFRLVGLIGRATDPNKQPKYLYSDNMPKRGILFNLCHAKTYKDVIIVEGSVDCMSVYQAGFPNVVAALGSSFSENQADLVNRHFVDVIIFADDDEAGRGLGRQIVDKCPRRNLYFAQYSNGKKDPGEMTTEEIRYAIENKRSHVEVMFEELFK